MLCIVLSSKYLDRIHIEKCIQNLDTFSSKYFLRIYRIQIQNTGSRFRLQVLYTGSRYKLQVLDTKYRIQIQDTSKVYRIQIQITSARYKIQDLDSNYRYQIQDLDTKCKEQTRNLDTFGHICITFSWIQTQFTGSKYKQNLDTNYITLHRYKQIKIQLQDLYTYHTPCLLSRYKSEIQNRSVFVQYFQQKIQSRWNSRSKGYLLILTSFISSRASVQKMNRFVQLMSFYYFQ